MLLSHRLQNQAESNKIFLKTDTEIIMLKPYKTKISVLDITDIVQK